MVEATLIGFSGFLDWRPLTFLKPIPRAWTCDICKLTSQTTVVPECLHVFCYDCYLRLLDKESPKCPLDMLDVDVDETKKFVLGDNQKKLLLVRCLNAKHGCKFEGPFEDLEAHYTKDCNFHVIYCRGCGNSHFRTELLEHLEKDCNQDGFAPCPLCCSDDGLHCESKELKADLVKSEVVDNSDVLIKAMKHCTADLVKNLMEAAQHCIKAADDLKKVTSSLAQPMLQHVRDVKEL